MPIVIRKQPEPEVDPQYKTILTRPSESFVSEKRNTDHIMTFSKLGLTLVLIIAISGLNAALYHGEDKRKFNLKP